MTTVILRFFSLLAISRGSIPYPYPYPSPSRLPGLACFCPCSTYYLLLTTYSVLVLYYALPNLVRQAVNRQLSLPSLLKIDKRTILLSDHPPSLPSHPLILSLTLPPHFTTTTTTQTTTNHQQSTTQKLKNYHSTRHHTNSLTPPHKLHYYTTNTLQPQPTTTHLPPPKAPSTPSLCPPKINPTIRFDLSERQPTTSIN